MHPELPPEVRLPKWRNERAEFEGKPLMLSFGPVDGGERLMGITRFEEEDGKIARVRAYIFPRRRSVPLGRRWDIEC